MRGPGMDAPSRGATGCSCLPPRAPVMAQEASGAYGVTRSRSVTGRSPAGRMTGWVPADAHRVVGKGWTGKTIFVEAAVAAPAGAGAPRGAGVKPPPCEPTEIEPAGAGVQPGGVHRPVATPAGLQAHMCRDGEDYGHPVGMSGIPDSLYHLVQNDDLITRIHNEELPPDEYYEAPGQALRRRFAGAESYLVDHVVALVASFDTAAGFALSFDISKFQLAQPVVKLVGELVGRDGRSPNPELVEAVRKWPR